MDLTGLSEQDVDCLSRALRYARGGARSVLLGAPCGEEARAFALEEFERTTVLLMRVCPEATTALVGKQRIHVPAQGDNHEG